MSDRGQSRTTHQDKESQQRLKTDNLNEQINGQLSPAGLSEVGTSFGGDNSIAGHASQLSNPQIPVVQRQKMAGQIGSVGGNAYLQRVMSQVNQNGPTTASGTPIQRDIFSDIGNAIGDALNIRENEEALDEWEDYQEASQALDEFLSQTYGVENFQSTTDLGMFDVAYDPLTSELNIECKCAFTFTDSNVARYADYIANGGSEDDLRWTDEAKEAWKNNFISTVSDAWSSNHIFYCQKDWWQHLDAKVVVNIQEVDSDEHFRLNITKIPPGEFEQSWVRRPRPGFFGGFTPGEGQFDSEDLTEVPKPGGRQTAAVHEAGHMLGLDDEYETGDTDDPNHSDLVEDEFGTSVARGADGRIMSGGMDIQPEHGVTFLEALKEATDMSEWGTEQQESRPIPANPNLGPGDYNLPEDSDTAYA